MQQKYGYAPEVQKRANELLQATPMGDFIEHYNREQSMTNEQRKLADVYSTIGMIKQHQATRGLTDSEVNAYGRHLEQEFYRFNRLPEMTSYLNNAISPTRDPLMGADRLNRMIELWEDPTKLVSENARELMALAGDREAFLAHMGVTIDEAAIYEEEAKRAQEAQDMQTLLNQQQGRGASVEPDTLPVMDPNTGALVADNTTSIHSQRGAERARERIEQLKNEAYEKGLREVFQQHALAMWINNQKDLHPIANELIKRVFERGQQGLADSDAFGLSPDNTLRIASEITRDPNAVLAAAKAYYEGDENAFANFDNYDLYQTFRKDVAPGMDPEALGFVNLMLDVARGKMIENTSLWADIWNAFEEQAVGIPTGMIDTTIGTAAFLTQSEALGERTQELMQFDATTGAAIADLGPSEGGILSDMITGVSSQLPIWATLWMGSAPLLASKYITVSGGSAALAASYAGSSMREMMANGASANVAYGCGIISGVGQSLVENIQFNTVFKKSGITNGTIYKAIQDGKRVFTGHVLAHGAVDYVADVAKETLEEGVQKAVDTISQNLAAKMMNEDRGLFEDVFTNTVAEMKESVTTMIGSVGVGGATRAFNTANVKMSFRGLKGLWESMQSGRAEISADSNFFKREVFAKVREGWRTAGDDNAKLAYLRSQGFDADAAAIHKYLTAQNKIQARHAAQLLHAQMEYVWHGDTSYAELASVGNEAFQLAMDNETNIRDTFTAMGFSNVDVNSFGEGESKGFVVTLGNKDGKTISYKIQRLSKEENAGEGAAHSAWETAGRAIAEDYKNTAEGTREGFTKRWVADESFRKEIMSKYNLHNRGNFQSGTSAVEVTTTNGEKVNLTVEGIISLAYGDEMTDNTVAAHETFHAFSQIIRDIIENATDQEAQFVQEAKEFVRMVREAGYAPRMKNKKGEYTELYNEEAVADVLARGMIIGWEKLERDAGKTLRDEANGGIFNIRNFVRRFLDMFLGTSDVYIDAEGKAVYDEQSLSRDVRRARNLAGMRGIMQTLPERFDELQNLDVQAQSGAALDNARKGKRVNKKAVANAIDNLERELQTLREGDQTNESLQRQAAVQQAINDYKETQFLDLERGVVELPIDRLIDNEKDAKTIEDYNTALIERKYQASLAKAKSDKAKKKAKNIKKAALRKLASRMESLRNQIKHNRSLLLEAGIINEDGTASRASVMGRGYTEHNGEEMSINALDAIGRGLKTSVQLANELGVPEKIIDAFPYDEGHHVGVDYHWIGFYYPARIRTSSIVAFAKRALAKDDSPAIVDQIAKAVHLMHGGRVGKLSEEKLRHHFDLKVANSPEVLALYEAYNAEAKALKQTVRKDAIAERNKLADERRARQKEVGYPQYREDAQWQELKAKEEEQDKIVKKYNQKEYRWLDTWKAWKDAYAARTTNEAFEEYLQRKETNASNAGTAILGSIAEQLDIEKFDDASSEDTARYSIAAEQQTQAQREYDEVVAKYKGTEQWMKAPNGKPTNLTERQWVQVRTPSFKKWFGNWEALAEIEAMKQRLIDWTSNDKDFEWAQGKTLSECEDKFGNEKVAIAYIPMWAMNQFTGKAVDNRVYCSKGYFIDHAANHGHADITMEAYRNLQEMFDSPEEVIKDTRTKSNGAARDSLIFVKKFARNRLAIVELSEQDGHIVLHKSIYNTRGKVYPSLPRIDLSGGGRSPISHVDESTPGGSLSARDTNNVPNFLTPVNQNNVSKIVDENGEPKVVYHGGSFVANGEHTPNGPMHFGTEHAASQRILDNAWGYGNWKVYQDGSMWKWKYVDPDDAGYDKQSEDSFASQEEAIKDAIASIEDDVTQHAYFLNIKNLKVIQDQNSSWEEAIEDARRHNVDGFAYKNDFEDAGSTSYIAFSPSKIKSATDNIGTFSRENNDTRYSITSEQDLAYQRAVEEGDIEIARQMALEAARAKGYLPGTQYRMRHKAPTNDGFHAPLHDVNTIFGTDDRQTLMRMASGRSTAYEAVNAIMSAKGNPDAMIEVWRAVPKNVKDKNLRRGDWVSLSEQYAREHGMYNLNGGYNLIHDTVPAKFLFTDGNMLEEVGFDDSKERVYQNTRNGSKLLDPTYDDNGNLIPLSKRFNRNRDDIRYNIVMGGHRGRGYDGYSMSVNARLAYERGEMPLSKWTKKAIVDKVKEINPEIDVTKMPVKLLKEAMLEYAGWHHTSKLYNVTAFYKLDEEYIARMTQEKINSFIEEYNSRPSEKELQEAYALRMKKIEAIRAKALEYEPLKDRYEYLMQRSFESSRDGNLYVYGRRPTPADYAFGLEDFHILGEWRIAQSEGKGLSLQVWDGKSWVDEQGSGIEPLPADYADSPILKTEAFDTHAAAEIAAGAMRSMVLGEYRRLKQDGKPIPSYLAEARDYLLANESKIGNPDSRNIEKVLNVLKDSGSPILQAVVNMALDPEVSPSDIPSAGGDRRYDSDYRYNRFRENFMNRVPEGTRYSIVSNAAEIERLNNEPTITVYRAMQYVEGVGLLPPMAARIDGKWNDPAQIGDWLVADERPDLVDEKGNFKLNKGNGATIKARYNPYFHTSHSPLNDQFSSAYKRPNLVTVEVEVPASELTSGYKAEKAKDSVGEKAWHSGPVSSKLSKGKERKVILSRWVKIKRIVPDSEVADKIMDIVKDENVSIPSNTVTPSLLRELENRGAKIDYVEGKPSPIITSVTDVAAQDPAAIDFSTSRASYATENMVVAKLREWASREGEDGAKILGWTEAQVEDVIQETTSLILTLHKALSGDINYDEWAKKMPTVRWDWRDGEEKPVVTWVRGNIEYKYDMSADTFCINNEGLENVLASEVMADLMIHTADFASTNSALTKDDRGYTSSDYLTLYEVLRDLGFVVPCKGCFDAAMRLKMLPSVAQNFVKDVNAVIDERNKDPEAFDKSIADMTLALRESAMAKAKAESEKNHAYNKRLREKKEKAAKKKAEIEAYNKANPDKPKALPKYMEKDLAAEYKDENVAPVPVASLVKNLPLTAGKKEMAIRIGVAGDNLTTHINWTQLMSAEGQTKALADWGGIFRAWQRTGAGRPKDKLLPEPWAGVMVSTVSTIIGPSSDTTPSFRQLEVNTGTGLRRNSHSEFRPILAVDEIQFMREAYLKRLFVFKYMKELDDVRLFGKLGVKFNMSAFPTWKAEGVAAGLDENGNYIMAEESVGGREFPYIGEDGKQHYDGEKGLEEAKKYINEDVSLSSVILSVPHLIKAMTDVPTPSDKSGTFGSLIPFHNSGATAEALRKQGLGECRATNDSHAFEEEAMVDYHKGVTNFEQVQNDRFGEGWEVLEGKRAGTKVEVGHKIEFTNGSHYYNKALGLHLFSSGYIYDHEIPAEGIDRENLPHAFEVDYNNKVREIGGDYAYKASADYYIEYLHGLGLIPRFDFRVPEATFLKMCSEARVNPLHPKLGYKPGQDWNPVLAESYYSLFCDYGMTDPATGKWSPHRPVGLKDGSFALPDNAIEIIADGVRRYSERKAIEDSRFNEAIIEYCKREIARGKMDKDKVVSILMSHGFKKSEIDIPMVANEEASKKKTAKKQGLKNAARASFASSRDVSMRELNSRALGEINVQMWLDNLLANRASVEGRKLSANEVKEFYQSMSVDIDPFTADSIAKSTNAKVFEGKDPSPETRTNISDRLLATLYGGTSVVPALGSKVQQLAYSRGTSEGVRLAQAIAAEVRQVKRIAVDEYEATKGTKMPAFEAEMGFSLTRTIMALNDRYGRLSDEERLRIDERRRARAQAQEDRIAQHIDAEDDFVVFAEDEMTLEDVERFRKTREDLQEAGRRTREAIEAREAKMREEREARRLASENEDGLGDVSDEDFNADMDAEAEITDQNFRSVLDLEDANEIVWYLQQFVVWKRTGDMEVTPAQLKQLARDPIFVRDVAMTLANVAQALSNGMAYSRNREQIKKAIEEMLAGKSLSTVRTRAIAVFTRIHDSRVRESRKEIIAGLRKFLKDKIVDSKGRMKIAKRDIDRKVTAEVEEEARMIRTVLAMGSGAVRDMLVKVEATVSGFDASKLDMEKDLYRDYQRAKKLRNILNIYGGAKHMSATQLQKLAEETEKRFTEEINAQATRRAEAAARVEAQVATIVNAINAGRENELERGKNAPLRQWIADQLDANLGLIDLVFEAISKQVKNGADAAAVKEILQVVSNHLEDGESKYRKLTTQYKLRMQEIGEKTYGSMYKLKQRHDTFIDEETSRRISMRWLEDAEGKKIPDSIKQRTQLTIGQVIQLKMSIEQADYTENAILWHRNKDCLEAINSVLTRQDLAWTDAVKDYLNETFAEAREAYYGVTGYHVGTTPNYWPVKIRQPEGGGVKGKVRLYSDVTNIMTPRVPHALDFDERASALATIIEKLDQQAHMIGFAGHDRAAMDILCNGDVRRAIRLAIGEKAERKLQNKIADILMGPDARGDGLSRIVSKFSGWFALSALAFNATSILRQVSGWFSLVHEVGFMGTAKSLARSVFDFSPETRAKWEYLRSHDAYGARYSSGLTAAMDDVLRGDTPQALRYVRSVLLAGMKGLYFMDVLFARGATLHIFDAKVKRYIASGMNRNEAMARAATEAWAIIERSQQSSRASNQFAMMNENQWTKLFSAMRSGPMQAMQYTQRNLAGVFRGEPEAIKKFIAGCAAGVLMQFVDELVNQLVALLRDDDDELYDEDHINATLARLVPRLLVGNLTAVPLLGDTLDHLSNTLAGRWSPNAIGQPPALSFAVRTATEISEAFVATFSPDNNENAAREWFEVVRQVIAPVRLADQIKQGQTGEGFFE